MGLDFQSLAQFLARGTGAVRAWGQELVGQDRVVAGVKIVGGENPQALDETLGRLLVVGGLGKHRVVRVVAHMCSPRCVPGLVGIIDLYYSLQKMRKTTR